MYVALSLRRNEKNFSKKEEQEVEVFENVSYSDVMFTQASTSKRDQQDMKVDEDEMKVDEDDEQFEQVFNMSSTRFLGIWLRQHQRRLYVVRVSHSRRHDPRLRPGVRLVACRSEMSEDKKWYVWCSSVI